MKTLIKIPVYHYENDKGHIIIDNESIRAELEYELKRLYLETKPGRKENMNNLLKNEKNEKNQTNTSRFLQRIKRIWHYVTKTKPSL